MIVDQVKKKKVAEAKAQGKMPPPSKKKNVRPPSRKRNQEQRENFQNDNEDITEQDDNNPDGMSLSFIFVYLFLNNHDSLHSRICVTCRDYSHGYY